MGPGSTPHKHYVNTKISMQNAILVLAGAPMGETQDLDQYGKIHKNTRWYYNLGLL